MDFFSFKRYNVFDVFIIILKLLFIIFCLKFFINFYSTYWSFQVIEDIISSLFGTIKGNRVVSEYFSSRIKWYYKSVHNHNKRRTYNILFPLYRLFNFKFQLVKVISFIDSTSLKTITGSRVASGSFLIWLIQYFWRVRHNNVIIRLKCEGLSV